MSSFAHHGLASGIVRYRSFSATKRSKPLQTYKSSRDPMKRYSSLLLLLIFTCGFSWGRPADKCEEAGKLATGLLGTTDRKARLEAEARILDLCPDGAPGQYLKGLAAEQAGN